MGEGSYFDKGEFEKAYEELSSVSSYPMLEKKKIPNYILMGLIKYIIGEWEVSVVHLNKALEVIDSHNTMSLNNKLYLSAYCNYLKNKISIECGDEAFLDKESHRPMAINYEEINLNAVKAKYKKNFPLIEHPEWSMLEG